MGTDSRGNSQGGPLSPLLANIYLHYVLDQRFAQTVSQGGHTQLYRYADDFIIVTDHPARMRSVRRALYTWMQEGGLRLKEEKTREVNMTNERRSGNSHLDFLGYRFHLRAFRDNARRYWIARQPSEKSRKIFREKLKQKLNPTLSVEDAKANLEAFWVGWSNYFKYGNANRVMYGEMRTIKRAVIYYLRRKFRHQRRPVGWRELFRIAAKIWEKIRPPKVISRPMRQNSGTTLGI